MQNEKTVIVTMTEGGVNSTKAKTTTELYMEKSEKVEEIKKESKEKPNE